MRPEYDFSKGERGKFFHPNVKLNLPAQDAQDWAGPEGDLSAYITEESQRTINAYADQPRLIIEHANLEQDTARGGYAHRQLFELVQNGADALSGASEGGHIAIRLTDSCLYCADDGEAINRAGVTALMFSHMSPKRGTSEIGRFGLGFKSVLGVTDAPEFFSRAGSFRFDRRNASARIREVAPHAARCPVLRVAEPVDPREARDKDPVLRDLMDWATNIVRLPLASDTAGDLRRQMRDFPAAFLLFVEHVRQLRIDDGSSLDRVLELQGADGEFRLTDSGTAGNWKLFKVIHRLSSDARADRRSLDDGGEVPIWWAAPLDRLTAPGYFWAYFPTKTASLVAGVLNAPWKTNEDRQNLLPGPYNDELIAAAAKMIADKLAELATSEKPARHLDALPRRHESGDSYQSERLRESLLAELCKRDIVPDQNGALQRVSNINYPPRELTSNRPHGEKILEKWAQFSGRPSNWLHREAAVRNRLARVEQLVEHWRSANGYSHHYPPRASIADWLEALVTEQTGSAAVEASRAALVTAAAIPADLRRTSHTLGSILLMKNGAWKPIEPEHVFLPRDVTDVGSRSNAAELVHPTLARDADARQALRELGVNRVSADGHLKHIASRLLGHDGTSASDDEWCRFWALTRDVDAVRAEQTITNQRRPPFVEVEGQYALPQLHEYQKVIVAKVRNMLRPVCDGSPGAASRSNTDAVRSSVDAEGRDRRGMISLPTGSGKTRVAVQAIVEAMCHDGFDGGVLWVADRDELCEQAVEAWTQVWSNVGASGQRLRVSRMWAGQPAPLPTTDLHVVVATIQTLHARLQNLRGAHDFLADCTLVVFDEAHRSIAPTFTSVMEDIGLTRWQRKDEPFLLGLTATPYRGHDAEETARLVRRYGSNRLDAGAFASDNPEQVVSELQRMHVLALADHETVEGGRFSLNADECTQMNTKPRPPWLPRSVEDRIAQDAARTNRIIDAYEKQVRNVNPEWPVLIFATSVEHARTIAALLSRIGVPSRAVSGETETLTRRRIVEEFRRGDLKVLVNYGVFREGFDAPKTRVLIVARPVYSPNLYFQMVGRGLRGTRNGGTERCLIINVQDNIDNFEGKLAFSDLDWLWA